MNALHTGLAIERHVVAARGGDREAFGQLVDATRNLVCSITLAIVRDAELSRDVAQEVFLAAWADLSRLREPSSFLPWLRQIARNRARHALRTERRRRWQISETETDHLLATATDPRRAGAERLLDDERRRLLREVLDALPDDAREVVALYYREGSSVAQVAALLDLGEVAVRKRLSRARATLRSALAERFAEVARATTPGPAFTASVLAALAIAAPVTASAATVGAAALAGKSLPGKLTLSVGGVLAGAAGGILGVFLGARQVRRQARDDRERRDLDRFTIVNVALVIAASGGFWLSWELTASPWSQVATFAAFIVGLAALHLLWLPRIVRRRYELEALEDPEKARRARLRERRFALLGWALGLIGGTAGLIVGAFLQ